MRTTWARTPAAVVAGLLALGAGAWWGLVRGEDTAARGGDRTSPTVDLGEVVDFVPGCTVDTCRVLARRGGFRFDGRDATMIVTASPEACGLHLVTADAVLWSRRVGAVCVDPAGGIETDRTGHAFVAFPTAPSRGEGTELLVLRFEGDEVEDFGSLGHRFVGRGATARDVDDDRLYELVVPPDVYRWNGQAYVRS